MILSGRSIGNRIDMIKPFCYRTVLNGMSYGLSHAGYDIRIKDSVQIESGGFVLATTVEHINMPDDLLAQLCDKSTWARRGLHVQNTIFEPGWRGYPTIELSYHGEDTLLIEAESPIGQLIFMQIDQPVVGYHGKYQNQKQEPVEAMEE